jgi:hypothetical protein
VSETQDREVWARDKNINVIPMSRVMKATTKHKHRNFFFRKYAAISVSM